MSNDIEKDDQATMEMMAMMGELPKDAQNSLEDMAGDDMAADDLLETLEALENTGEDELVEMTEEAESHENSDANESDETSPSVNLDDELVQVESTEESAPDSDQETMADIDAGESSPTVDTLHSDSNPEGIYPSSAEALEDELAFASEEETKSSADADSVTAPVPEDFPPPDLMPEENQAENMDTELTDKASETDNPSLEEESEDSAASLDAPAAESAQVKDILDEIDALSQANEPTPLPEEAENSVTEPVPPSKDTVSDTAAPAALTENKEKSPETLEDEPDLIASNDIESIEDMLTERESEANAPILAQDSLPASDPENDTMATDQSDMDAMLDAVESETAQLPDDGLTPDLATMDEITSTSTNENNAASDSSHEPLDEASEMNDIHTDGVEDKDGETNVSTDGPVSRKEDFDEHTTEVSSESVLSEDDLTAMDDKIDADLSDVNDTDISQPEMHENANSVDQAAASIEVMETSVSIDEEVQSLTEKVAQTAKEASLLALEVSRKAQASADRTQQAIEQTFAATERAFEIAKKANYEIDMNTLDTSLSSEAFMDELDRIRRRNDELKETNASLSKKIQDLLR